LQFDFTIKQRKEGREMEISREEIAAKHAMGAL